MEQLTIAQMATRLHVTGAAVRVAIRLGRISRDAWTMRDGRYVITNAERAAADFAKRKRSPGGAPNHPIKPPEERTETLYEAQTRHEKVKIEERTLKLQKAEDRLIDRRAEDRRLRDLLRARGDRSPPTSGVCDGPARVSCRTW